MALSNFVPQLWSARLLHNLNKVLVFGQAGIINRDYEGEIKNYGDTVKINSIGRVTIGDYTRNTNIGDPETLTDAQRTLLIDQSKYFNFQIDDLDAAQQNPKVMDEAMKESAYALANVADQFIAGHYVDAAPANLIGTDAVPIVLTDPAKAYEYLVDLGVKLDEANIPADSRWTILPPWVHGLLLKDDRFVKYGEIPQNERLVNGKVGRAAGFDILTSNNCPQTAGTKYKVVAGHSMAWSFADQVNQVEGYRPQQRFADAVKGLHMYGGKVVRPEALAVLTVNKS